jgi:hypothetical protein
MCFYCEEVLNDEEQWQGLSNEDIIALLPEICLIGRRKLKELIEGFVNEWWPDRNSLPDCS